MARWVAGVALAATGCGWCARAFSETDAPVSAEELDWISAQSRVADVDWTGPVVPESPSACEQACAYAVGRPIERLDRCRLDVDPAYAPAPADTADTADTAAPRPGGSVTCAGKTVPWCR